jgi:hypothetical protein
MHRIDRLRIQAGRLRKSVRQHPQAGASREEIRSVLLRFTQAGLASDAGNDAARAKRLRALPLGPYLELVARESGHEGWSALVEHSRERDPDGEDPEEELYRPGSSEFHCNIWCASYEEAREYLDAHRGHYLLQYREHFFLARAAHIEDLGLDPRDEDWERIGRDWVRPADPEAKVRLWEKLGRARKRTAG